MAALTTLLWGVSAGLLGHGLRGRPVLIRAAPGCGVSGSRSARRGVQDGDGLGVAGGGRSRLTLAAINAHLETSPQMGDILQNA